MIMNALNGVKCFKSLKADKDFEARLNFKAQNCQLRLEIFTKLKLSALVLLVMKIRKNIQSMYQKMLWRKTRFIVLRRRRKKVLRSYQKILIHSCMIINYIVTGNIFVAIVYKLLAQGNMKMLY